MTRAQNRLGVRFGVVLAVTSTAWMGCRFAGQSAGETGGAGTGISVSTGGGAGMTAGTTGHAGDGGRAGSGGTGGSGGARPTALTDFPTAPVLDPLRTRGRRRSVRQHARAFRRCALHHLAHHRHTDAAQLVEAAVRLQPASGDNLFEVDLSVPGFAHPLRLFSANPSIALDRALWDALRVSVVGKPITVTARGLTLTGGAVTQGPSPAATTSFTVAPVDAPGKIVYWALADDMGAKVGSLKGFGIGEEGVQDVLVPSQVPGRTATEKCVGCHAATPDGNGVGFTMGPDGYTGDLADIRGALAGQMPTFVSPTAITTMRSLHGIPRFRRRTGATAIG